MISEKQKTGESAVSLFVRTRLKKIREELRRMSPEELAARVGKLASSSYIRRIEKGDNQPTVEMLARLLEALNVNIGTFFEPLIEESFDVDAKDRRYQRIIQRGLEKNETRDFIKSACALIEDKV